MKTLLATIGAVCVLITTPSNAQMTDIYGSTVPEMHELRPCERDILRAQWEFADTEATRNMLRVNIAERIRKQKLLNAELGQGYRNLLTAEEQKDVRNRLDTAETDADKNTIIAEAQKLAQSKLYFRDTSAYSLTTPPEVATKGTKPKYAPMQ